MQQAANGPDWPTGGSPERRRLGSSMRTLIAWAVILAAAGWMMWESNAPKPATAKEAVDVQAVSMQEELAAKIVIGLRGPLGPKGYDTLLDSTADLRDGNTAAKRLGYTVLVAELKGPEQGLTQLKSLTGATAATQPASQPAAADSMPASAPDRSLVQPIQMDEVERQIAATLQRIYEAHAAGRDPALAPSERDLLADRLGWIGRLAPVSNGTPDADARGRFLKSVALVPFGIGGIIVWYGLGGVLGFASLVIFLVWLFSGAVRMRLVPGSEAGGVYAETFAIWLLFFIGARALMQRLVDADVIPVSARFPMNIVVILASMSVLAWPVICGVPWREMRRHLGLQLPARAAMTPAYGVLAYGIAVVFMGAGVVIMLGLTIIQKQFAPHAAPPSHPIVDLLPNASWATIIWVLTLGAVIAPITEEIMFRGVLYRHLRDSSGAWPRWASGILSAAVSSFIFAGIHPQGWTLIPVLGGLACGFCLAREWHDSVVPGMIAHGMQNFVTLSFGIILFS